MDWIQKYKSTGRETNKEPGVVMKPGRGLSITGVMDKLGCCDEEHPTVTSWGAGVLGAAASGSQTLGLFLGHAQKVRIPVWLSARRGVPAEGKWWGMNTCCIIGIGVLRGP